MGPVCRAWQNSTRFRARKVKDGGARGTYLILSGAPIRFSKNETAGELILSLYAYNVRV